VLSETCTFDGCGQEVRFGTRDGRTGWHHREAVDHNARFGVPSLGPTESRRLVEEWRAAHDETAEDPNEHEEPLATTPEIYALPVDTVGRRRFVCFPDGTVADAQLPGGARTVVNAARKTGWTISATYARGPWMHSSYWTPTRTVDHVALRLSRGDQRAVATWRTKADGTYEFKTAWVWTVPVRANGRTAVNSKELRELVKSTTEESA